MKLTNKQKTKIKKDESNNKLQKDTLIEELPLANEDSPIRGPSFIRGGVEEIQLSFPNHQIIPNKNAVFCGLDWVQLGLIATIAALVFILL